MAVNLKERIAAIPQATPYGLSTTVQAPELPAQAGALSSEMQSIARNYLGARARAGEAILDAARYLAEARQVARRGEWGIFLEATGTTEDTAQRMLSIANRASADQQYARAISDGRLAFTAAFELLNAPEATQKKALESADPTPASAIRADKQTEKLRTRAEFEKPNPGPTAGAGFSDIAPAASPEAARGSGDVLAELPRGMITISTDKGPKQIPTLLSNETLALHNAPNSNDTILTYVPSGRRIAAFARYTSAGAAFAQLEQLDWRQMTPEGAMPPPLVLQVTRILVQYPDVDQHGARVTRLAKLEAKAQPAPEPEPALAPAHVARCARCGAERTRESTRQFTTYSPGMVQGFGDGLVTLCSVCIPELLREQRAAASTTPPATTMAAAPAASPEVASGDDVRAQILTLLEELRPLIAQLGAASDQMGLSQAIADLNECEEGTEPTHWLKVGYALIDLDMED